MTDVISEAERNAIRADVLNVLPDMCLFGAVTESQSGAYHGEPSVSWGTAEIPCFVDQQLAKEHMSGQATLEDAVIRVMATETVANTSLIKVTKRFGETLASPEVYAVQGAPKRDLVFLYVNCKLAVGNARG